MACKLSLHKTGHLICFVYTPHEDCGNPHLNFEAQVWENNVPQRYVLAKESRQSWWICVMSLLSSRSVMLDLTWLEVVKKHILCIKYGRLSFFLLSQENPLLLLTLHYPFQPHFARLSTKRPNGRAVQNIWLNDQDITSAFSNFKKATK